MFDVYVGASAYAYTFYNATKTRLSGQNSVSGDISVVVPAEAKYVRFSSRITNETPSVVVLNEKTLEGSVESIEIKVEELPSTLKVEPRNTTFFKAINYFDPAKAVYYTDRFLQTTSGKITASATAKMLVIPVKPNTEYYLNIPNANRYIVCVTDDNDFSLGKTFSLLVNPVVQSYPQHFTTGATTSKVGIFFNSGDYDYDNNKDKIVLNIGSYTGEETPYIPYDYLPKDISSVLKDAQVLIFGDSITSTCNFTINADKETTAMMWKSPSNSYVDAGGNTVRYSMWPKILKDNQPCGEIRNYAMSGASYRTQTRESGYERQNLQYQIDVALNDIDNPNNVFEVADYVPDIVIFALGTNDGVPNDTYDSAMSATVYDSTVSTVIDVDATISALDDSKTIASARKAFMRIKKAFPLAQIFCVLPIQRANNDTNLGVLHDYLKQIAQRYGCIIIDGASDSGITRDGNIENALGVYLKDGLHPNEKGQNLMARMIISSLMSHYVPFGTGFN